VRAIRAFSLAVIVGFVVCGDATTVVAAPAQAPVIVESGQWQGHAWRLEANDETGGSTAQHCYRVVVDFKFTTAAPPRSPNCAALSIPRVVLPPGFPHGFAFSSLTVCPLAFVDGLTVAQAAQVVVTLSGGKTVHISTVVPPPGLRQDVRYFAAQIPCGSPVTKFVGLSASGRQVALFAMTR
jgi:hypothetical protein